MDKIRYWICPECGGKKHGEIDKCFEVKGRYMCAECVLELHDVLDEIPDELWPPGDE